jgi:hypothetical protein
MTKPRQRPPRSGSSRENGRPRPARWLTTFGPQASSTVQGLGIVIAAGYYFDHKVLISVVVACGALLAAWGLALPPRVESPPTSHLRATSGDGMHTRTPRHRAPPSSRTIWILGEASVLSCSALIFLGVHLLQRDDGLGMTHKISGHGLAFSLAFTAGISVALTTLLRIAWSLRCKQMSKCPGLWRLAGTEVGFCLAGLAAADLLLIPALHGWLRATVMLAALLLSSVSFCGFTLHGWRRIQFLRDHGVQSMSERTYEVIQAHFGFDGRPRATAMVKASISAIATMLVALPLLGSGMATALTISQSVKPTTVSSDKSPDPAVFVPDVSAPPPTSTLGASGYAALCGSEPYQQPGYGTSGLIEEGFASLWDGANTGLGGNLAGCWGPPEIVKEASGVTAAYDIGSINGSPMSLAIATSDGSDEIFLGDGGREVAAAGLLAKDELITGTGRFNVFNGDFQLIYAPDGTVTTVRAVKHPTGIAEVSQHAQYLTAPETTAWIRAMTIEHEWLWPSDLPAIYGCQGGILFTSREGDSVATACAVAPQEGRQGEALTLASGVGGRNQVGTVWAVPNHVPPQEILALAGQ